MSDPLAQHAHALIELENYGALAESLGEATAKLALEEFVDRLKRVKRRGDALVKLQDNVYCLVLRNVRQRQHVTLAASKIEREFSRPVDVLGEPVRFSIHTGIALPSTEIVDRKQLIRCAKSALRVAKEEGVSHKIFSDNEATEHQQDPNLLLRLKEAIDVGEFVPYFQPKVSAAYGTLVGAEALVRWHDTKRKKVFAPGDFIEVIEGSGLIKALTVQILKNSIARCATWPHPLHVAVNITPKLLGEMSLVTEIEDTLAVFELAPERLILEVTERGQLPEGAIKTLEHLNDIGVKIAIDDFGTGESSLLQFRSMPAKLLKIDRSFVAHAHDSEKDAAIIRGVVELAHQCKMLVVAEGVEDASISALMRELGCDWLQGYWFGKPLPHDQFIKEHKVVLVTSPQSKAESSHVQSVLELDDSLAEIDAGE